MQKSNNLQEIFLTKARKQSIPLTIFLMNGFQLRGVVTGFDCFTVVLDTGRASSRSSISTLFPPSFPFTPSRCRRSPACRRASEASQHSTKEEP